MIHRQVLAVCALLGLALASCATGGHGDERRSRVLVHEVGWNEPLPHGGTFVQWKNVAPGRCRVSARQALSAVTNLYQKIPPVRWQAPQSVYVQRTGLLGDLGTSSGTCSYVVLFAGRDLSGRFPPCLHGCTEYWLGAWPKVREEIEEWYGAIVNGQTGKIGYGPFFGAERSR